MRKVTITVSLRTASFAVGLIALAVLASLAASQYSTAVAKRREMKSLDSLTAITLALAEYHERHGAYPTSLSARELGATSYLPAGPPEKDAWGRQIQYLSSGHDYVLWSHGSDGTPDQHPAQDYFTDYARDIIFVNGCAWSVPAGVQYPFPCEPCVPDPIRYVRNQLGAH